MAIDPNYVDVAERIREFREKHPEGSLQPADLATPYRIEHIGDQTFLTYSAAAYRTPDDPRPGIGTAWEPVPGKTNFTRDSELMNAETSAWGRAIVAVLAADTKKIVSADEVRNRQYTDSEIPESASEATTLRNEIVEVAKAKNIYAVQDFKKRYAVGLGQATVEQLREYRGLLETGEVS